MCPWCRRSRSLLRHHHSDALEGPRSTSRPCLVPRPGGPHRDQDRLPKRARRVVREWVLERQMELMANWARGERREPFERGQGRRRMIELVNVTSVEPQDGSRLRVRSPMARSVSETSPICWPRAGQWSSRSATLPSLGVSSFSVACSRGRMVRSRCRAAARRDARAGLLERPANCHAAE